MTPFSSARCSLSAIRYSAPFRNFVCSNMAEPEHVPLPEPEPSDQLVPPPRKPPTAMGLREPGRGRSQIGPPISQRLSRISRISRIMLGSMLLVSGVGLALVSPVGFVAGGMAIAAGTRLIGKTIARAA